jgi:serine/threonine-protein kinase
MTIGAASYESTEMRGNGDAGFTGLVLQDTYTLGPCIGRGGMGEVYEATHVRLPGRMAVKILRPHLLDNEAAFARFCREAEIMSAVQHPHIIQIFDFNNSRDGLPYFVMEYLDGVDLEARLAESGALPVAAVVRIVDAVASALGAAHALGIVHRDLKPANIFLMRGGGQDADFVKVIDFGISKSPGGRHPRLSRTSDLLGTPQFMAPEQALGLVAKIDARTDQFALAEIAYAMLTGHEPFAGDDPASLLYQVVHERHPPLSRFVSWDTTRLQPVLDRALSKRQEDRFDGIVDFARALAAAAGLATEDALQPTDQPPPVRLVRPAPAERPAVHTLSIRIATPFSERELPRSVDRVPREPQRAVALALALLGLTAAVIHKGWYHKLAGRAAKAEHTLVSAAQDKWRASRPHASVPPARAREVPAPPRELPPAVKVAPPVVEEIVPTPAREPTPTAASRRPRPHRSTPARAGWQIIEIVNVPAP